MRIDINDYGVQVVGKQTLNLIKEDLKTKQELGYTGVEVDFRGKGINIRYTVELARMVYKYGCKLYGIGNKEYDIDIYLTTGYFIKEHMGRREFAEWFISKIEDADYPLMVRDNRFKENTLEQLNIIKPLYVDDYYFYYDVIMPRYLEPRELVKALHKGETVHRREKVEIKTLGNYDEGFRFVNTMRERYMVDIFDDILKGRVRGFVKG